MTSASLLLTLLMTLAMAGPASAEDTCYRTWIFKDRSGRKVFRVSACKRGAPSKSGYYEIENLTPWTRRFCWTVVLGNGKKSEGCRTLEPREVGSGSCYSCNPMHQGGAINALLRKFYDPNVKDRNQKRDFEGSVVGPDGRTLGIGLNPVGSPPPSRPPPGPGRGSEGPNIVEVPEHPGRIYSGRLPPRRGIPTRPGLGRGGRTAPVAPPVRGASGGGPCGMGPQTMAEFAAFSTDPGVVRARLEKLRSMLACLDKQPATAANPALRQTLRMLEQSMQQMAR